MSNVCAWECVCLCVCVCDRKPNKGNMCNLYGLREGCRQKARGWKSIRTCFACQPNAMLHARLYFTRGHNKLGPRLRLRLRLRCRVILGSALRFLRFLFFISAVDCVCAASLSLSASGCQCLCNIYLWLSCVAAALVTPSHTHTHPHARRNNLVKDCGCFTDFLTHFMFFSSLPHFYTFFISCVRVWDENLNWFCIVWLSLLLLLLASSSGLLRFLFCLTLRCCCFYLRLTQQQFSDKFQFVFHNGNTEEGSNCF